MIVRSPFILPGNPWIIGKLRAEAPCGCTVWMGVRGDNKDKEVATSADPCRDEHKGLMEAFNTRMAASLRNPTDRPLIEVIDDMLGEIAEGWETNVS